ncbi:MAG: ketopantoate reductase family protein [Myxococcota bacterium]
MRYAVMGAGAVGSHVGGMLARAGLPVILIGRRAHVDAIKDKGLEVSGLVGPFRAHPEATTDPAGARDADVVLLCVKSQDTVQACEAIAPHLGKNTPVVSIQNGVRNMDLIDGSALGPGRGVGGSAVFNAVFLEAGRVLITTSGELIIGATSRDGRFGDTLARMAEEMRGAGLSVRMTPNIEGVLWSKLLINLNNGLGALTGQTLEEGMLDPGARSISAALLAEGIRVTAEAGIHLGTIPKVDPKRILKILTMKLPTFVLRRLFRLLVRTHPDAKWSTWQSLSKGLPTEIAYLNGEIVSLAESNGLHAPYNRAIRDMVLEAEKNGAPPNLSTEEIAERLSLT